MISLIIFILIQALVIHCWMSASLICHLYDRILRQSSRLAGGLVFIVRVSQERAVGRSADESLADFYDTHGQARGGDSILIPSPYGELLFL